MSTLISLLFYDEITSGEFFPAKIKTQDSGQQLSVLNVILAIIKEVMAQKLLVVAEQHCVKKG